MDKKEIVLTTDGMQKLKEELEYLKTQRRKEVSEKIKQALSFGDLSENAEYDEAKNEQAEVESRVNQIEDMLKYARILSEDEIAADEVGLGSIIKLKNYSNGKIETLQIVSSNEANFAEHKISDESPIGAGAMKKKVGDSFMIEAPAGELQFEILEISK